MKLRVRFTKKGPVKFIGHLDTMRFFQRALRRAGFDLAYSKGFSPHPIMNFASPLGVGLESDSETFDLEVESITDSKEMTDKLNEQMCEGITIRDIRLLPDDAPNAMASVKAAAYTVNFTELCKPDFDIAHAIERLLGLPQVIIIKKTKKNELSVDIKPGIYELFFDEAGIHMLVDASSGGNIRPEQVVSALMYLYGADLPENALHITRNEIYTENSTGELIPLIDVAEEYRRT